MFGSTGVTVTVAVTTCTELPGGASGGDAAPPWNDHAPLTVSNFARRSVAAGGELRPASIMTTSKSRRPWKPPLLSRTFGPAVRVTRIFMSPALPGKRARIGATSLWRDVPAGPGGGEPTGGAPR